MDILESVLGREINAILTSGEKPINYRWVVNIKVGETVYTTIKVLNMDFEENPEENFAPRILTRVLMEAGTYFYRILPFDDQIKILVNRYTVSEKTRSIDYSIPPISEEYRGTIVNKIDPAISSNFPDSLSEKNLNVTDFVEVEFQLLNEAIEQLRLITVGGIPRKTDVKNLLETVLTASFNSLKVDNARLPIGVDMVDPSNKTVHEHFPIKHGMRVVDLPDYIQNNLSGVYSSGLGHFIKDEYWYIYPKYDLERTGTTQRTLTVIRVPPNKLPMIERTYRINGGNTIILATDQAQMNNISEYSQMNEGGGARFATADNFLEDFTKNEGNRALARRGNRANEFIGKERPTGINAAFMTEDRITSNPYRHYSDIAKRQGNLFTFTWENSNMDLILPGMLVKILMLDQEEILELSGTLLSAYHAIQLKGKGVQATSYITRTVLNIFVKPLD